LLDILYGTDKAKEYAKMDAENWSKQQIRGYHVGPPVHVVRRMYNGGQVLKYTEPNYTAEGHDQIWKTQEENMVKQEKNEDSLESFAKAGLWIMNTSPSKSNLNDRNIPIADRIKNQYNTTVFNTDQVNFESTNATDNFDRRESAGSKQSNSSNDIKTPAFRSSYSKQTPVLGNRLLNKLGRTQNTQPQTYRSNQNSNAGFRMTFNGDNPT
jgi:hypothetical protein